MRDQALRHLLVGLVLGLCALAAATDRTPQAIAADNRHGALVGYPGQFEEYVRARAAHEQATDAYWTAVAGKRQIRKNKRRAGLEILLEDYVLTQPPVYIGPPKPTDPDSLQGETPRRYVPVVGDFLRAAVEQYNFAPERPRDELEYKREYARTAAAAGLSKDQIVRVYAFESGGNGKYDVQAGLEYARSDARAISTALGYNQLLATNSVGLMAENGDRFVRALTAKSASLSGPAKAWLEQKFKVVRRMEAVGRSVPDSWPAHAKLAQTSQGLGIHAAVLDIHVGPLLQTQKLLDSVIFARRQGVATELTAAELEMMNLTGDGNGLDMVMMPAAMRGRVPTANFFQRAGYELNTVASRNAVVDKLFGSINAIMDREAALQGARDMADSYPK